MPKNPELLRFYTFLSALLLCSLALGQGNSYQYDLHLIDSNRAFSGSAHITFHNTSQSSVDTLFLHLPSRSLTNKNSFLNQQYAEFQKIDLYYAKPEETGSIELKDVLIEGFVISKICSDCEFVSIPIPYSINPGDSATLSFSFYLKMGNAEFNGSGFANGVYRLIDWLPAIPTLDSNGFHLYPVTFQRDQYDSRNQYDINLEVPSNFTVASNCTLTTVAEKQRLKQMRDNAFTRSGNYNELKQLHFTHIGTNLQFLISPDFYLFPIKDAGTLYLTQKDPLMPSVIGAVNKDISDFFKDEIGSNHTEDYDLVLLDEKFGEYQSDHLLTLDFPKDIFTLSTELAQARAEMIFRYRLMPDGIKDVWMARGIPYFYKYLFVNQHFPEKKWLPLSNTLLGRFFALDEFDFSYQNQFLYLYLARQGLDQKISTPADSLTRLNYEAIAQAKTYLALSQLRQYVSPPTFSRSMRRFMLQNQDQHASPVSLQQSFQYFFNRDLDWFFNTWIHTTGTYDYRLSKTDHCATITTATVKNVGTLDLPYSLTGIKNGKPVLTEWHEGHSGTKSVLMYHDEYDEVRLNYYQDVPEYRQKNNTYYNRLLFPRLEPLRLQFYYSFEDPNHSQLYWTPTINYNAYDKVLLGLSLDNSSIVQKPFEYILGPDYSTGTGKLTGYASFIYNYVPHGNSLFHQISAGIYGRYYHYDQDLRYVRVSPAVNFYFKKSYPRSPVLQRLRFRFVDLHRELPAGFNEPANEVGNSSYLIFNINHRFEYTDIFHPYTLKTDFLWGDQFSKISFEGDFRRMLPNKKWLIWRNFLAYFPSNKFAKEGINNNYYSLGLSGTKDFLFDYSFIGRSDETGIWSQQFFITDGGFKSPTGVFSDQWMVSSNLSVPIWSVFGIFGDVGFVDNTQRFYYDYGFRISIVTDFLEIYFPIANQDVNFLKQPAYYKSIRFVLDIDQSNIINRLRRGYY